MAESWFQGGQPFKQIVPAASIIFLLHYYKGLNFQNGSVMHILVIEIIYIDRVLQFFPSGSHTFGTVLLLMSLF